ncbi:MAG: GTP-binding protein [Fimbriimonas sp.]|nr:GTP-binding protein [Fimbriimonas sp.]
MAAGILRLATAGSVDDGKSSLIGRLLYDSKSVLEDQMRSIEHVSRQRGSDQIELALLTDGLRAEREQNITIDVAYRYFATAHRKFIIADTPGHLQYTRNMVTGTSTADLSVLLVDARKGILSQSKRHAAISALLGVRHVVVAINKMDLVEFSEPVFDKIAREFGAILFQLGIPRAEFIPISALLGDNVVEPSENMRWYTGPTLLGFLEKVEVGSDEPGPIRLPVQYVIRPNQDFRGFAGRLEGSSLRVGDVLRVASTGLEVVVDRLLVAGVEAGEALPGEAVTVTMDREIEVSRGDLLYSAEHPPLFADRIEAVVCWMSPEPLRVGQRYVLLHGPARVSAIVEAVQSRIDIDTLLPASAQTLAMNDIGRVVVRTARPLAFDPYADLPSTGSFVLVDPGTHATVAGGMIQGVASGPETVAEEQGRIYWIDGWSGDLRGLASELRRQGHPTVAVSDTVHQQEFAHILTSQGIDVLVANEVGESSIRIEPKSQSIRELIVQLHAPP